MTQDIFRLISRTQAEYARCIDDGALEDWPGFFLEDCFYKVTTADNHRQGMTAGLIWANTRRMLADRVSALRDANIYERHTYRHMLNAPAILEENGDAVRSETSFFVVRVTSDGPTDIFATGRYLDRWRIDGDVAKLAERIVVCDSSRTDTLLALPL
ncbi:MAG TPA: aromatic-ring-hydroxylating dioxygenase subunit beta [Actinomadura sp.]|nr:aromatic-ring-hydroxylating dioxygenase subunit beta [Actinomadura sp.]